jgi:hypothetical protein
VCGLKKRTRPVEPALQCRTDALPQSWPGPCRPARSIGEVRDRRISAITAAVGAVAISGAYALPDAPPADPPEVKTEKECRYAALNETSGPRTHWPKAKMELAAKGAPPSRESVFAEC